MNRQAELFTSEWGVRNDVKHLVDALQDKLPAMGMVKNANKNRCLEKFERHRMSPMTSSTTVLSIEARALRY